MVNNPTIMLTVLVSTLIGLPMAVCIDHAQSTLVAHAEDDKLARATLKLMPPIEGEMQDTLMEQLAGKHAKLYHPKTAKERALAIADVWGIDLKKPLEIATR